MAKFDIFPFKFMNRKILFKVHVTREFFLKFACETRPPLCYQLSRPTMSNEALYSSPSKWQRPSLGITTPPSCKMMT